MKKKQLTRLKSFLIANLEKNLNHVYLDGSRNWTDIIIAKAWVNMYFSGLEVRYSEISNPKLLLRLIG